MQRRLALLFTSLAVASATAASAPISFNRDVRPILSDKCFSCHGPDAAAKKVPLRLDSEAAARAVIVAGDPGASTLMKRAAHEKAALRMPPPSSGLALTPAEIGTLASWIEQGAKWEKHWAFLPPKRQPPPTVRLSSWIRNPVDAFVLAQLERESLLPSPEASRETLLRRVTYDLTGLPPTPDEIDAFVRDRSEGAYQRVVDRLLASPRYGERMAIRWLDAARYADTNGYQFDGERFMWRWRDWVIDSFNRNQPYDKFVIEQLAGDLLPNATVDQQIATGFNRNHRANTEDGIIPEEYAVEYVVDRVETTSTVFLGLTMGCARCHNHKYDPLSQRDFYRMFAYFNNVPEMGRAMKYGNSPPVIAAPLTEQRQSAEALQRTIEAADATLAKYSPPASVSIAGRWAATSGQVAAFPSADFDGSRFVDGGTAANFEITEPWSIAADIRPDTDDGSIVSRMVENEKGKGYGVHLDRGKVHVHLTSAYADDAIRVETEQKVIEPGRVHHVTVTYDGTVSAAGVQVYIDGQPAAVKVLLDSLYRPFGNAGRKFSQPLRVGAGWGPERRFRGHMESLRIYDRVLPPTEIRAMALRQDLSSIAAKPSQTRSAVENFAFRSQWLNHEAPQTAKEAWATKLALERKLEKLQRTFPTVMVMRENPKPRPAHLLIRGAYDKPGETVDRGTPDILGPLPPGSPNDRLGLALWVANAENPLTARVAVNRIWQMMFGAGIVRTTEDFGLQGDWPSHPDLLDWLATEFVRSGWDMKGLVRLIVTSATYRQSSALTPGLLARDPDNRLLARGPRHRLSPEMIRDSALTAAGLLNTTVGGPSVKPYQPAGLWQEQAMQDMEYVRSTGPDLYRRSLYTFWKRTIPPPMMMNFDAAARETCVVRETRTNTPLQGLNLMNDVTFVEAARVIGQRMLLEGGSSPEDRLRYGFRLVLSREPKTEELAVLARSLAWHRDYFASDSARSREYLAQGEAKPDASVTPGELAAYGSVASLILNLDEAVTKQ